MSNLFITYGDTGYEVAKAKILSEAEATREFQEMYSYGREDLSQELMSSDVINVKRGGGLWSWKPDVTLSTMLKHQQGDIVVYCDAGCTVCPSREWNKIKKILKTHDIIAQRIFQRTDKWTRKEIVDYFAENGDNWLSSYQFLATVVIIKISDFTLQLVKEWRNLMIEHPEFAMDVTDEERKFQRPGFIENRHDQAIYSALIYKYLSMPEYKDKIYTQWEHIEDLDPFSKQAIRATRLRLGQEETQKTKIIRSIKRVIKDYIYKPFYYAPLHWWYSRKL